MKRGYSVFEYVYRDASNYKAWGKILLIGLATPVNLGTLRRCLESDEFFVAEQIGIPVLYQVLWALSSGPNNDDHAYHEFFDLRPATIEEIATLPPWGNLSALLDAFHEAKREWNCTLSVHCHI